MKPTARNLRSLPDGVHCLERGVYLRVRGNQRTWIYKYQKDGKRHEVGLGSALDQTIAGVLAKAAAMKLMVSQGADPTAGRKAERAERKAKAKKEACPTFEEFIEPTLAHVQYMRQFTGAFTLDAWRRTLNALAETLGPRRLDTITRDDIAAAFRPVWSTRPRTARDYLNRANGLFEYAKSKGYVEKNPAEWKGNLDALLPSLSTVRRSVPEKHHAALAPEELSAVAKKLAASDRLIDKALLFGMLTVGRCSEWRCARWEEFDDEACTLSVPQARRKDKKPEPFVVPLSRQAMAIVRSAVVTPGCPYVFEGEKPGTPWTGKSLLDRLSAVADSPVTVHGTRSTFSDWCAQNDKNFLVSEKCLMHAVGGKVFMAYQRDDLLDKRRQLLQEWADFLLG